MFAKRIAASILSSVILSGVFGLIEYVPESERDPNVLYFSFLGTFVVTFIYSLPVFFIVGIPTSMLIDWIMRKSRFHKAKYLLELLLYTLFGTFFGILVLAVFIEWSMEALNGALLGSIGSILYFHVLLLLQKFNIRKNIGQSGAGGRK
jgi:hypothetical protein